MISPSMTKAMEGAQDSGVQTQICCEKPKKNKELLYAVCKTLENTKAYLLNDLPTQHRKYRIDPIHLDQCQIIGEQISIPLNFIKHELDSMGEDFKIIAEEEVSYIEKYGKKIYKIENKKVLIPQSLLPLDDLDFDLVPIILMNDAVKKSLTRFNIKKFDEVCEEFIMDDVEMNIDDVEIDTEILKPYFSLLEKCHFYPKNPCPNQYLNEREVKTFTNLLSVVIDRTEGEG